jgi:hypothetical protein
MITMAILADVQQPNNNMPAISALNGPVKIMTVDLQDGPPQL